MRGRLHSGVAAASCDVKSPRAGVGDNGSLSDAAKVDKANW